MCQLDLFLIQFVFICNFYKQLLSILSHAEKLKLEKASHSSKIYVYTAKM